MIDSATDIKIFIEQNKSANLVVSKEKFQDYNGDMSKTGLSKAQKLEQKMPHHSFIVDDNYMAAVLPSRKKAQAVEEEKKQIKAAAAEKALIILD